MRKGQPPAKEASGPGPAAELLPLVYQQLRRLAHRRLSREPRDQILQTTALVHEAYLRLEHTGHIRWENRAHFFAAAATAMRRILVERARRRRQRKHGAGHRTVSLDEDALVAGPRGIDMLALDEALKKLASHDARACRVVNLRYFAGLSVEETAGVLEVSPRSVKRAWTYARAWLRDEMTHGTGTRRAPSG